MARPTLELTGDQWRTIGAFVAALRRKKGWTQEQAAAAGGKGLSRAPLGLVETGKPMNNRVADSTLDGIQRAFDLPSNWWDLVLAGRLTAAAAAGEGQGAIRAHIAGHPIDVSFPLDVGGEPLREIQAWVTRHASSGVPLEWIGDGDAPAWLAELGVVTDEQFAVAAHQGEQDTTVGKKVNRPSPEPEPEGP